MSASALASASVSVSASASTSAAAAAAAATAAVAPRTPRLPRLPRSPRSGGGRKRRRRSNSPNGSSLAENRGSDAPAAGAVPSCELCLESSSSPENVLLKDPVSQLSAHYECLLFSSGLSQSGALDEGLRGFLAVDVAAELRRGRKLKCVHCKRKGATVGCAKPQCKKSYHLPCGIKAQALQQHYKQFKSYCAAHRPVQKVTSAKRSKGLNECPICQEAIEGKPTFSSLWIPCCNAYIHRVCLQNLAFSSGKHHFRCPLCNENKRFSAEMQTFGINLPDQDASWEENSWAQPLMPNLQCQARLCLCEKNGGRSYNSVDSLWELIRCTACGHEAIHAKCGGLEEYIDPDWYCYTCRRVVRVDEKELERSRQKPLCLRWGRAKATASGNAPSSKEESIRRVFSISVMPVPVDDVSKASTSASLHNSSSKVEALRKGLPLNQSNLTLEDLINHGLDREARSCQPSSRSAPAAAAPGSDENSPVDSDYESGEREQNHGTEKKRKTVGEHTSHETLRETIQKSIKNYFIQD